MSTTDDNTSALQEFKRFGMRVDLSDPAVVSFMQATGIPQDEWRQFDKSKSKPEQIIEIERDGVEVARPDQIPAELLELGVVGATKRTSGYDVRYEFVFFDGDTFAYTLSSFQSFVFAGSGQEMVDRIVQVIQAHRVLPFD